VVSTFRTTKLNQHDDKSKKFPSTIEIFAVLTPFEDSTGVGHVVRVCERDTIYEAWLLYTSGDNSGMIWSVPSAKIDSITFYRSCRIF
jgi:hypothetical protein